MDDNEKLIVQTPFGGLVAYASCDPDHPGIYIDLGEGNESKPVALIEFCKDEADLPLFGECLITRVWDDMDQEGYTSRIVHTGLPKSEAKRS